MSIAEHDFDSPMPDVNQVLLCVLKLESIFNLFIVIQAIEDDPWPSPLIEIGYPAVPGRVMSTFALAGTLCAYRAVGILFTLTLCESCDRGSHFD